MDAEGAFQNTIPEMVNLPLTRYENIFRVFKKSDKYVYNILRTVNLDLGTASPDSYSTTSIRYETSWTNLSYQAYGVTDLWWLIYITNKTLFTNPVQLIPGGTQIRFIKPDKIQAVLEQISNQLQPKQ